MAVLYAVAVFVSVFYYGVQARGGAVRVSWKECNMDPGFREDCGYFGITEEKCYERECCFAETASMSTPWCYHSKPTTTKRCSVSDDERIECGSYGIRKEQCLALECCWKPSNGYDTPWCFQKKQIPLQVGECGVPVIPPMLRSNARIVGGEEAKANSWPWQVSLQIDGRHFCGGSIVNENYIVSAAHCGAAFSWGSGEVVAGAHALDQAFNSSAVQRIAVDEIFKNEDYDYDMGTNELSDDIMLIRLQTPLTFTDYVTPICIPAQGQEYEGGMSCYATGWGTVQLFGDAPNELQQVRVPIVEQETCVEWYEDPQNWYNSEGNAPPVTEKMICAGFEEGGRGTCHGDSGGPMVSFLNGRWELVGVVSWGGPCAHERTPSVFARVSYYHDWMLKTINDQEEKRKKK